MKEAPAIHRNAVLLQRLFISLNARDAQAMAECYHPDAHFHDIAFDLQGKREITAMWKMICSGDIQATFEVLYADDREGLVKVVDEYTFSDTLRKVRNPIESRFGFRNGLIALHTDTCDPVAWAAAAIGGIRGVLAGRIRFLRSWKARRKLKPYLEE